MVRHAVHIVETTLRDGGYEVDFQFTPEDTAFIAEQLDRAGFEYIEICHGHGFGTSHWKRPPKLPPAATDDAGHIAAAVAVVRRATLGVLFIVGEGFTPTSALDDLARLGVKLVRFGFLPDTIFQPDCLAYIDHAKALGLTVSINLMQTYGLPLPRLAEAAKETARRGADWFYVVDSAGCMTTTETAAYVRTVAEATSMRIGLHAHNNTGLANANVLAAIHAGATLVDSTLQGIGRATGNPSTEQTMLALQSLGHEEGLDRRAVLALGDACRPLFAEKGSDPTSFVSGTARVHSRYIGAFSAEALRRGRAPREFIYQIGRAAGRRGLWDGETMPSAVFDEAEAASRTSQPVPPSRHLLSFFAKGIARVSDPQLGQACAELFSRAIRTRRRSVLHLVPAARFPFPGPMPWESGELCGITLPVTDGSLLETTDRAPQLLLIDSSLAIAESLFPSTPRLHDAFVTTLADATATLVATLRDEHPLTVVLANLDEDPILTQRLGARLTEHDLTPSTTRAAGTRCAWLVDAHRPWPEVEANDVVIVVRGARSPAIDRARANGVQVLRPPLVAAITGKATLLARVFDRRRARPEAASNGLVDTTVAATATEIVVDDVASPTHVVDRGSITSSAAAEVVATARVDALLTGRGTL